jgi:hypothetical protein
MPGLSRLIVQSTVPVTRACASIIPGMAGRGDATTAT